MALPISTSIGPPLEAWTQLVAYDGTNPQYIGWARSCQLAPTVVVAAVGFTNIVVLTNVGTVNWTAHGLAVGNRIVISGATVDAQLNGEYVIATAATDSFTITTASVADATYTDATLTITTYAPRTGDSIWAIQKNVYSGDNVVAIEWAEGRSSANLIWTSRATYAYN